MKVWSDATVLERPSAVVEDRALVLQIGPALSVRGGVATLERLIVEHAGSSISIRHLATVENGSLWRKLLIFANAVWCLRAALRTEPNLLVHIHFASRGSTLRKCVLAWMTARAGRPLILHAHGGSYDDFFERLPRVLQHAVRRIFAQADCFVVLSTQWRDFYTTRCGLSERRVRVLHNPTEIPAETPDRTQRTHVQFLFLGRICARKGSYDLLAAFKALPNEVRARARLVFAGDGQVEDLRELASEYEDQVVVHSWINRAQRDQLLADSDAFVLPSYLEGVPMSMLEAMATALPVITTPVGGIPDVVADGREGLLVTPGDIAALSAAMRRMIDDESLRLTLGLCARSRAESFDVREYSVELHRIYRRLLGA